MARVLVMGTGAVGGYFGGCLMRAGHDVTFVARGPNLDALASNGLRVTGAMGEFALEGLRATSSPSGDFELALLCVKTYDLAGALVVGDVVLTLQNGVDAPFLAREALGDVVLGGSTGIVADLPEPGHVHVVSDYAWIRYGELDGRGVSDRVERVRSWLDVEGVQPLPVGDARISLWEKMSLMCGMAGLTTLYQRPMGELLGDPSTREEFEAIVGECFAVARAKDVPLGDDFVAKRMGYAAGIDPAAMSSMSRDFARGRNIEIETFNGAMVRMGAELGIDVPRNRAVYEGIKAAR
jgi:2-dehydropantoate 2-reductase